MTYVECSSAVARRSIAADTSSDECDRRPDVFRDIFRDSVRMDLMRRPART
jgi:hypothetical protein